MAAAGENSTVKSKVDDDKVTIKISGGFDYYIHAAFRDAYKHQPTEKRFFIDLSKSSYIDSAAIGMLLVLLEYVGNEKEKLHVVGCNPKTRKMLDIAKLGDLMVIT